MEERQFENRKSDDQNRAPAKSTIVTQVIPVIQEQVTIGKQEIEAGKVVVSKSIEHHTTPVHVIVNHDEVQVAHVPAGYYVEKAPEVRYEGDTMIIPVLKEEAVVVKKIYLVEELHVTRTTRQSQETETVTLRTEHVDITRVGTDDKP